MNRRRFRVTHVYRDPEGSPLDQTVTTTSPASGGNWQVQSVAEFSDEGGEAVVEPGTAREEPIKYAGIDEENDLLLGVLRGASPKNHSRGTFVQVELEEVVEKLADGYFDDDTEPATGVPIPPELWGYFPKGARSTGEEEVVWVGEISEDDDQEYVISAPVGRVPNFDEDQELLPPDVFEPVPPVDEIPVSGNSPSPVTNLVVTASITSLLQQPVWALAISFSHTGLKMNGQPVNGLHFSIEVLEGTTVKHKWTTLSSPTSVNVEGNKTYTVRVRALDIAEQSSTAVTSSPVTTTDTTSAPAAPTGLLFTGGANGGGNGMVFVGWNPNTEVNHHHYEVHASTSAGFTPSENTRILDANTTSAAIIKAWNGSAKTSFGYGTVIYIQIIAVTTSAKKSPPSSEVSGSAQQIQSDDVADLQSVNFVSGTSGWKISKNGNAEFLNGVFRGTVVAGSFLSGTFIAMSSSGNGTVVIDGSNNQIRLGSPASVILSGVNQGRIEVGSGPNVVIDGSGGGSITIVGGSISAASISGGTLSGTTISGGSLTIGSGPYVIIETSGSTGRIRFQDSSTHLIYESGNALVIQDGSSFNVVYFRPDKVEFQKLLDLNSWGIQEAGIIDGAYYIEQLPSGAPAAPSSGHRFWHDTGAMKVKFGNGTVKTIATNA